MPRLTRAALVASLEREFPGAEPMTDLQFMARASAGLNHRAYPDLFSWAAQALWHPQHLFYVLSDGQAGIRYGTDGADYISNCPVRLLPNA